VLTSVLALTATIASIAAVACADSTEPEPAPATQDGSPLPVVDASVPPEASADADAEAAGPPRECSDQGFCPTKLPDDEQTLRAVWGDGTGVVWSVSEEGSVLRWDGNAWKVHASGLGPLSVIWGASPTDVWIGGEKGIFHGTGAASASLVFAGDPAPGGAPVKITSIWGASASDVWATAVTFDDPAKGRVVHFTGASTDAGPTWALDGVTAQGLKLSKVWGTATSGVWVAGSRPVPGLEFLDEVLVFRKPAGATKFSEVVLPQDPNGEPDAPRLAVLADATASGDSSMWLVGRDRSSFTHLLKGTSANSGQTFTFTLAVADDNKTPLDNALWGVAPNDTWLVGDSGRVRHFDGTTWAPAAITVTKFPVIEPFYAVWSKGSQDLWVVGHGIALHRKQ
jgi:hypothetical protein